MTATPTTRKPVPEPWAVALIAWHRAMTYQQCSPTTIKIRLGHLRQLARALGGDPFAVTAAALAVYVDGRTWQAATRRNYVKTFRAFYRWAYDAGRIGHNPALSLALNLTDDQADRLAARAAAAPAPRTPTGPDRVPIPPAWADWLGQWTRHARAAGTPATTIRTRTAHLRQAARGLDPITPAEVCLDDLLEWMAGKDWAPESRRSVRSTLRAFFRWAAEAGHRADDPAERLPKVTSSPPVPRPASETVYADALARARTARERLALRLAAELGLRRAEVAKVHARDVLDTPTGPALVVHGKGGRERVLPLPAGLADELGRHIAAAGPGYVFPAPGGGHVTPDWMGTTVRALLAGTATMHQLRHRFATVAYEQTRDLLTTQQVLGHSSPATTQRYIAVSAPAARALMDRVAATTTPADPPTAPTCPPAAPAVLVGGHWTGHQVTA